MTCPATYATQVKAAMPTLIQMLTSLGHHYDAQACRFLMPMLDAAVHFALPKNGRIFDDAIRGLRNIAPRLPYPVITISYRSSSDKQSDQTRNADSTRRLVLGIEIERNSPETSFFLKYCKDDDKQKIFAISDVAIMVFSICWFDNLQQWLPLAFGQVILSNIGNMQTPRQRQTLIAAVDIPLLPQIAPSIGCAEARNGVIHPTTNALLDIAAESSVILELCEALTCQNVSTQIAKPIDAAVNARRLRNGKLPMLDTHILTIYPGCSSNMALSHHDGGTHASPRQHLRRGHIRHLSDNRNIWVNNCVVGSAKNGTVNKSYRVRHG